MELYKVKIPLDSFDIITGTTVVSGNTVQTGYVNLTKTADTYVNIFLTSDYDDFGIYTDFNDRDIFDMITAVPIPASGNTQYVVVPPPCVNCSQYYPNSSDLPTNTFYIYPGDATNDSKILYNFTTDVYGFNFEIEFCECDNTTPGSIYGGAAATAGMTLQLSSGSIGMEVWAFGGTGAIPAGHGILTYLNHSPNCTPKKIINYVFQGGSGGVFPNQPIYITEYAHGVPCDPCCTHDGTVEYVAVETEDYAPCFGELLYVTMDPGDYNVLTIDPGGPYETIFTPSGGTMCLPIGCYEVIFSQYGTGSYTITDTQGAPIVTDGVGGVADVLPGDEELAHLFKGEICIKCKTGKLEIATYEDPLKGYTGATAYVMPTTICDSWWVTGTTRNNIMDIFPIGGGSYLSTTTHARYDANDNPIEVTFTYGPPAVPLGTGPTGSTYNIGEGSVKIYYDTPNMNTSLTSFRFFRECCEECYGLNTKEEMKMGWVFDPKINVNVFIDRGQNSVFDKLLRISEVNNNDELLDYDNNSFNVNKQHI